MSNVSRPGSGSGSGSGSKSAQGSAVSSASASTTRSASPSQATSAMSRGGSSSAKSSASSASSASPGSRSGSTASPGSRSSSSASSASPASGARSTGSGGSPGSSKAASGGTSAAASERSDPGAAAPQAMGPSSMKQVPSRSKKRIGELDLATAKIGFMGAGKMTESLVEALIKHGNIKAGNIAVAAPSKRGLNQLKELGVHVSMRTLDIFGRYDCDIIFFAFHGHVVKKAIGSSGGRPMAITTNFIPNMRHPLYFLSLVGGVSKKDLKKVLLNPENMNKYLIEDHRIMCNTAVAQGVGLCAVDVEPDSKKLSPVLRTLLSSFAKLEYIPENQMDAACAIAGSGLAFAYYFMEAMSSGGTKMGLNRDISNKMAAMTCICAARAMLESNKHPSELKEMASAAGGAAVYGVHVLDKAEVAAGIAGAVEASYSRATQLSKSSD